MELNVTLKSKSHKITKWESGEEGEEIIPQNKKR